MNDDHIYVVNSLPWSREISGPISSSVVRTRVSVDDETSSRHYQDRAETDTWWPETDHSNRDRDLLLLPPTEVPGFGYTTVSRDDLIEDGGWPFDERRTVETDRYRFKFDRKRGGIQEWYDKKLGCHWVDRETEYPLGGFVHERVAESDVEAPRRMLFRFGALDQAKGFDFGNVAGLTDTERGWQPDWHARRTGPVDVVRHRVYETPLGYDVHQYLDVPQLPSDVELRLFIPNADDSVIVESRWEMGTSTHPEATYLAFPFSIPDPTPRIDVGGVAMQPGRDQLPGSCHDYYTAQRWVDLSNNNRGMTVGCPLNPMVQLGDFNFGANKASIDLDRAFLLGWITNNYWDTNFRAHQPGIVRARYHLAPHDGPFDQGSAHRVGMEAEDYLPVAQLAEPSVASSSLPAPTSLLELPDLPIIVIQIRPEMPDDGILHPGKNPPDSDFGNILVVLRNTADRERQATLESAGIQMKAAERLDQFTGDGIELDVTDGETQIDLEPGELTMLRLTCKA